METFVLILLCAVFCVAFYFSFKIESNRVKKTIRFYEELTEYFHRLNEEEKMRKYGGSDT